MEGLKQEMINWLNCLATNEVLFMHVIPNIRFWRSSIKYCLLFPSPSKRESKNPNIFVIMSMKLQKYPTPTEEYSRNITRLFCEIKNKRDLSCRCHNFLDAVGRYYSKKRIVLPGGRCPLSRQDRGRPVVFTTRVTRGVRRNAIVR